jgi:SAM-dependent methyltransferase
MKNKSYLYYKIKIINFLLCYLMFHPYLLLANCNSDFCIKDDYICRSKNIHYNDSKNKDHFQNEVYEAAYMLFLKKDFSSIADIGCGSGYKLLKYFKNYNTFGFEIDPSLSFLLKKYPDRNWIRSDFSVEPSPKKVDMIVCSDVIEHLINPNQLLDWLQKFDFKFLVISTPDRDKLLQKQGKIQSQTGPPVNRAHVREWSFDEFEKYISKYFRIEKHFNTKKEYWGQVIIAEKRDS